MWKKELTLEEAIELSYEPESKKIDSQGRWTQEVTYVIKYKESPTTFAQFSLTEPLSYEEMGIMDVNYTEKIELIAVKPKVITSIKWEVVE